MTKTRGQRALAALPVLASIATHAAAHERWAFCALAAAAVLATILANLRVEHGRKVLLVGAAAGAVLGAFDGVFEPTVPGPLPPSVLAPLTGACAGLAAACVFSDQARWAWTYALLLAALSLVVPVSPRLLAAEAALGGSLLAAVFSETALSRGGARAAAAFAAYVAFAVCALVPFGEAIRSSERWVVEAVLRFAREAGLPAGVGLRGSLAVSPRSAVDLGDRALFEITRESPDHLRAVVLDRFDGVRFSTSPALDAPAAALPPPTLDAAHAHLFLLDDLDGLLPVPAATRAAQGVAAQVHGGDVLRAQGAKGHDVTLALDAADELPAEEPPGPELTELPAPLRAALLPHARTIVAGADGRAAQAAAIERFFRTEFTYALHTELLSGRRHPLLVLVEDRRPAYCSYFAAAMVALLRSLDVPARVVGGFLAEPANRLTGRAVVRERDAHAWVEAYLGDRWVAFDPTPSQSRDAALGIDRSPGALALAWDALASAARRFWSDPWARVLAVVRSPLVVAAALLAGALLLFRRRRARRARTARAAAPRADPRLDAAYRAYLRVLRKRARLAPSPAETDDELVARLEAAHGTGAGDAARAFLAAYRPARFGAADIVDGSLRTALQHLDETLGARDSHLSPPR